MSLEKYKGIIPAFYACYDDEGNIEVISDTEAKNYYYTNDKTSIGNHIYVCENGSKGKYKVYFHAWDKAEEKVIEQTRADTDGVSACFFINCPLFDFL